MPRFPITEEADAPPEVLEIYRSFTSKMGYPAVPSFVSTQGASPAMLAGTCSLVEHLLLEGTLPRATKELIFLAVAADRECEYSKEAHAACCRMLGVDDETIEVVSSGLKGDLPDSIREVLLFAIKCAAAPEELTEEDFGYLSRLGLSRQQKLEVIATSALAVYATIIANATLLEPDAMFAAV
jgi:uncharacterized peroxidase-related enzyme